MTPAAEMLARGARAIAAIKASGVDHTDVDVAREVYLAMRGPICIATLSIVERLHGRAAFCRDRAEIKTPELLEEAAEVIEHFYCALVDTDTTLRLADFYSNGKLSDLRARNAAALAKAHAPTPITAGYRDQSIEAQEQSRG